MSKTEIETAQQQAARAWAEGLGLAYYGVDLADTVAYSYLSITGRLWLIHEAEQAAQGASHD